MGLSSFGVAAAAFLASAVEFVEALTIVLALGLTRGWRSSLWGAGAAMATLALAIVTIGPGLTGHLPRHWLQLVVGALLLVFGLQWLRKAIFRSAGLIALHDEDEAFASESAAARIAPRQTRFTLDWYAFTVSFKGVLLEGLEVAFIVVTFGASSADRTPAVWAPRRHSPSCSWSEHSCTGRSRACPRISSSTASDCCSRHSGRSGSWRD